MRPYDDYETRVHAQDPKLDQRAPSKSKNSRHWCRGKRGVPHKLVVGNTADVKPGFFTRPSAEGKILYCEACGKEFDLWWPRWYKSKWPEPPIPAWVTEGPQAYVVAR